MGRPKIEISPEAISLIECLAGFGLGLEQISTALNISKKTLQRWKKTGEVKEAFERGHARAEMAVAKTLFDKAIKGDLGAIIWWEKTRAGRHEQSIQHKIDQQLEADLSHVLRVARQFMRPPEYETFVQTLAASRT